MDMTHDQQLPNPQARKDKGMARIRAAVLAAAAFAAVVSVPAAASSAAVDRVRVPHPAVCGAVAAGFARCHARVLAHGGGSLLSASSPTGLGPAAIKAAYTFPTELSAGAAMTVALVDAYDDPSAETDLNVFSAQYDLPACTTANGCFTKVNQAGGTSYPRKDAGWALEISLDVQWAHAIAPGARILLVEATSNSFANLLAAEDYAKAHAAYLSNSWGGAESSGESRYDAHFFQPGVSVFVAAGDSGLPAEYPSSSPNVVSVGGTTLHNIGTPTFSETGWSGGGGGCSAYESAPSAQASFSGYGQTNCAGKRATPDVSLDADPTSGVAVYDSTSYQRQSGWFTLGGTSAASPMWAARSAVAGAVVNGAYVYGNAIAYRDITGGNNGAPCLIGFDLCTGRGSWTGTAP